MRLSESRRRKPNHGVISAVKSFYFLEEHDALGGLEKVGTMLDRARYSSSLSSKLTAHLQRIDRTDLIPVSYTHLDVYKRQDLNIAAPNLEAAQSICKKWSTHYHFLFV